MGAIATYRGLIPDDELGPTLMHEHVFVRSFELEANGVDGDWDAPSMVQRATDELTALHALGIRTIVDLTVPGLGRDAALLATVAERVPLQIVAATGWYTPNVLPVYFAFHGPDRLINGTDPLVGLFIRDISVGIAGTGVRAGILKVMTDADGVTPDVARVMDAAAAAHRETGVTITTHSHPASRNGLEQQAFLRARGVPMDRVVIGHSGDTEDVDYLRALMDNGSTIGMDRFGMEHVLADERRAWAVATLVDAGYADRMVLSHDAAIYSHVTPPRWRATNAPRWRMDTISRHILPTLRDLGVPEPAIRLMLVHNPRRLLMATS